MPSILWRKKKSAMIIYSSRIFWTCFNQRKLAVKINQSFYRLTQTNIMSHWAVLFIKHWRSLNSCWVYNSKHGDQKWLYSAEIYGPASQNQLSTTKSISLAAGLEVIAYDPRDKIIRKQSLLLTSSPFLGVQWHPEFLFGSRRRLSSVWLYVNITKASIPS